MSNNYRGPDDDPVTGLQGESIRELARNTRTIQSNIDSVESLNSSFRANLDVVGKLTAVVEKAEQTNLQALAAGTTYSKFTKQNTEALKGNISTQLEMTDFLMGGFQKGLRDVGRSTADLADDMLFTGQTTEGLIGVLGGLSLLTSTSNKSQSKLSKSILKNTANYGITATSMIQALNAVKASLEAASVFGDDAVTAYTDSAALLKAAMGGAEGSDKAIATLLNAMDPKNIGQQQLLGLTKTANNLNSGIQISLNDMVRISKELRSTLSDDSMRAAFLAEQLGKDVVQSVLQVGNGIAKGNKLTGAMKANEAAKLATITAKQKHIDQFYESFAPQMHEFTVKYLPLIALSIMTLKGSIGRGVGNAFTNAGMGRAASPGVASIAKVGLATRLATGAMALAGPIGIGLAVITTFMPMLSSYMKGTEKNTDETAKRMKEKEKKDIDRAFSSNTLSKAASLASGMLRKDTSSSDSQKLITVIKRQIALQEQANASLRILAAERENQLD